MNNFRTFRRQVEGALEGLKVTVTHRTTSQKFKIADLTDENTRDISFDVDQISDRKIRLVDYLGKNNRKFMFLWSSAA